MAKSSKRKTISLEESILSVEHRINECYEKKDPVINLSGLNLEQLPEKVRNFTWLESLIVFGNNLKLLPDWIGELKELRELQVYQNPLEALPHSIKELTKLRLLYIEGASSAAADEIISALPKLEDLAIARLELEHVPDWVRNCKALKRLHLFGNRLSELPDWLSELSQISYIGLMGNSLQSLPISLLHLESLRTLRLGGNADLHIPAEILKGEEARKILDYYFRTAIPGTAQPLNEFKLILVGRGLVGKTSLVNRLVTGKFKRFQRTPGINITKWPRKIDSDDVHAHIWDFGGQEIMHGTHRFFMTERALYLVLISGREGTEDHDAEYWLSMVRSFAGDVPVIVLLNKYDDYRFELNRELLREKYGRDLLFIETDSFTGTGFPILCSKICELAKKLPGLKAAWPTEWRLIKSALPAQKKSWLTFGDFRGFCQKYGITEAKDQEDLAESLHDLGLMLSYRKEEALRSFGVLNPEWVTDGIYNMLNSSVLRDAGGAFTVAKFAEVLPLKEYPPNLHPYLLALMRKFQLCHPLDDKGEKYLIPELLTKEEPKLDAEFPPETCLTFLYSYDTVLPEGLLPRFIVETYVHQKPRYAWRTGVVLERANCRALVRGDIQGRKVTIRVVGPSGRGRGELLGIIREYFERIHKSYEKLPVTEMVPVPGYPYTQVRHDLLLKYERSGRDYIAVDLGEELQDFSVNDLLDGIDLLKGAIRRSKNETLKNLGISNANSIFISYSHKDERFRDELRGALTAYERIGELDVWDDTLIKPGHKWEAKILEKLERSDIIVLLLSNDFIKSDYCMQKEMQRALERDKLGECAIVPIVVRSCRFDKLEVGQIQAILPKAKPIKEHKDRDSAWLEVTKQIDRVIERLKNR